MVPRGVAIPAANNQWSLEAKTTYDLLKREFPLDKGGIDTALCESACD